MGSRGGHSHFGSGNRNIGDQWTDTVKKQIKDFGTKLGISVSLGDLISGGIRPDLTMSALKDVEAFYTMFPAAKGIVKGLENTDSPNAYAAMSNTGILKLGLYGKWDLQKLSDQYKNDLLSKYHPANTDYHSIVWHELGHALEAYIHKKEYGFPSFGPVAVDVLENATMKVMGVSSINTFTPLDTYNYAKTISKYAISKKKDGTGYTTEYNWQVWETIAEAVGDYAQNKANANEFSIAVAEEVFKKLNK